VIPKPASSRAVPGVTFLLSAETQILVPKDSEAAPQVGAYLADLLRSSTGHPLPVTTLGDASASGNITLRFSDEGKLGPEGYVLDVRDDGVVLIAETVEGAFRGAQTLRQLLPPEVEGSTVEAGPWLIPGVHVEDKPRFEWRGAMLDVARHFFTVDEVKRYIDLISMYKINRLHLHLSDDQGWRIYIEKWPRLATHGGSVEVGGGTGGYYTQADYTEIVEYAARRYIMIVPEIESPGHTNAALASYAELNCDGAARTLYTGADVGFSSLCVAKEITYEFLDDVIGEIAAVTPGPYFHIGGDEAHETTKGDYARFIERAERIVNSHGKAMVGWEEIVRAGISSSAIAQHWSPATRAGTELARAAVARHVKLVMSPARNAYLDMKYDSSTPLGVRWAGFTGVRDSYEWEPTAVVPGVGEDDIVGVEAPLWTETLETIEEIEFMAFPRLAGIAEIGWSPATGRSWDEYRNRLAAQGPRWDILSVHYCRSPEVDWG
jgi:hexosaminidase